MVYRFLLLFCIALLLPLISYSSQEYVVKKGDNLYDLSRKFDVSVDELKEENNLRNNRLNVGDKLLIPNSQKENPQAKSNKDYIVKSGDTLGEIAGRYGVSTKDLKDKNSLKSSNLQIGQLLRIPSSQESQDSSTDIISKDELKETAVLSEKSPLEINSEITVRPKDAPASEYTVKSGDTLGHIADRYGVTSKSIKELNGLKGDKLSIGQSLKLHSNAQTGDINKSAEISESKPLPATYVVRKGDFPGKIAQELGVSTKELIELNNLKSKSLQIGQVLTVPGGETPKQAAKETEKNESQDLASEKKADTTPAASSKDLTQDIYIVNKGDTPGQIAEKLGVSTKDLVSINKLNSRSLQIGQKLKVPGSESRAKSESVAKETAVKPSKQPDNKPETAESSPVAPHEYIVKKGDSLYVISKKYKISVSDIKKKNNLKGNNLSVGQKLTLGSEKPGETDARAKVEPKNEAETLKKQKQTGKYTVKKGDTVSQIALKFGISQKELKRENGLRSSNLRIGQVLKVPGQSQQGDALVVKTPKTKNSAVSKKEPDKIQAAYVKKRYVVKAGDTLSGIANHFNVGIQELKKASALKNDKINKGDVLLIPVPHDYVATPKRAAGALNHTVVTGDTLGSIASKYGVAVSELKGANGLTNNELWVGMKLSLPEKGSQLKTQTARKATDNLRKDYTVKRGDTLGVIAKHHGVTVKELKKANNLRSSNIRVGQSLKIPGTAKYMHSYSAKSEKNNYDSNSYTNNGHSGNGFHSKSETSPKQNLIKVAKKYLGAPYKFGGYSYKTGIDCSGYVKKVFSSFNVELPRTARDIYYRAGYKVAKSQLDTGDLVFFTTYAKFPSHVGIYLGDGQFIHASSGRKRVTIDKLSKRYYRNRYIGAKRVQVSGLFYDEYSKEFQDR
jgi:LysM repeat protein